MRKKNLASPYTIVYMIGSLDVGGAERQLVELVKGIDKSQFRPVIYTMESGKNILQNELDPESIQVKSLNIKFKGIPIYYPSAIRIIFRELYKLFHAFRIDRPVIFHGYLFWAYILGGLMAIFAGVPIIITSRRSLHTCKTVRKRKLYDYLEKFVNFFTDLIIANSQAVMTDTIQQECISEKKIIPIYNGIRASAKNLDENSKPLLFSKWKRYENEVMICVIANLIQYKGHKYLLEAIPLIKSMTDHPFRVILIGADGNARSDLDKICNQLNIDDDVVFAGRIPRAKELLPLFDISVLPSLEEGFSNTVIESMMAKVPTIATNVGGNPEAIIDQETGFIVQSKNSQELAGYIAFLIDNPHIRLKIGLAGHQRATAAFSMDNMISKTQSIYLDLINRKFH